MVTIAPPATPVADDPWPGDGAWPTHGDPGAVPHPRGARDQVAAFVEPWDVDGDRIMEIIGDARVVLIGEATHGTHEFYRERAQITRRLIAERGFGAVAIEADWPGAARVDRYVRGAGDDTSADAALSGFRRFPDWVWRNTVVASFVDWLRSHNASRPAAGRVGVYGLDLYSLHASMAAVVEYLERTDPAAAERARLRYGCFDHASRDGQAYGWAVDAGILDPCEDAVVAQLDELRARVARSYEAGASRGDPDSLDALFHAEQNARVARDAEAYYRAMYHGREEAWNLRDRHMAETLREVLRHLDRRQRGTRVVVWAHNSHLGDARATGMAERGEWNLGQLLREWAPDDCVSIGFSTSSGTVTAAREWGEAAERRRVRPGLRGSWEDLFHGVAEATGRHGFLVPLDGEVPLAMDRPRLQRAIGVVYRPESERWSHYTPADLPRQFDALVHLEETTAVTPLERSCNWHMGEPAAAFPPSR
jgi:erythromycin esterase-like protein